jgi:hypothetical protein
MTEVYRDPTIDGFCRRQKICRASYYNLKKTGKGPREYYVGRLVRISPEAEAEWVREGEAAERRSA